VALAAAALALHRAGAPRVPLVLLALPAYLLFGFDHAVPFGSLAFGSFFSIALWLEFGGRKPASSRANRSQITPLSQRECCCRAAPDRRGTGGTERGVACPAPTARHGVGYR
jgi:hypothetical protein